MIAVGVASPRAHGHATMRTATKFKRATVNVPSGTATYHPTNVIKAIAITVGTKTAATRSARR